MGKLAAVGWLVALAVAGISFAGYQWLLDERQQALQTQAAEYEAQLAKVKADAEATVAKVRDDALAQEQILKAELDFANLPALPLKFAFRANQVLYVENDSNELFTCKVRLTRPDTGATLEHDFSINPRAFKDLAAIDQWLFRRGDQIEFSKPAHKPWKGEFK